MTMTESSAEEDEHKDYNYNYRGVGGGYTTRPRDWRRRRRCQRLDDGNGGLAMTMECLFSLLLRG